MVLTFKPYEEEKMATSQKASAVEIGKHVICSFTLLVPTSLTEIVSGHLYASCIIHSFNRYLLSTYVPGIILAMGLQQ